MDGGFRPETGAQGSGRTRSCNSCPCWTPPLAGRRETGFSPVSTCHPRRRHVARSRLPRRASCGLARLRRQAGAILAKAGQGTADYILAHRIPGPAKALIRALPAPLGARLLTAAIARHAWTFTGSGRFRSLPTHPSRSRSPTTRWPFRAVPAPGTPPSSRAFIGPSSGRRRGWKPVEAAAVSRFLILPR
jgi:hypothetical protein